MATIRQIPITAALIIICCICYVVEMVAPAGISNMCALSLAGIASGAYWEFITNMFMHGGITHLLCNMVSLYCIGSFCEKVLGRWQYLSLYFVSGITGGIVFIAYAALTGENASAVGASGAIFGLLGAYAYVLIREHKRNRILVYPPTKQDVSSLGAMIALNIFISLNPGIAWQAHLGGFVAGTILTIALYELRCHKLGR